MLHPQKYDLTELEKIQKSTIIKRRIVKELTEFHKQHAKGLPMQMLSAKYSKSIQNMGIGFPEFIDTMRLEGLLQVQFLEHGARAVHPANVHVEKSAPIVKDWF